MIEQQLYARSSSGYFLRSPGYDTVRFSNGLNEQEVQANHEHFSYEGKNVEGIVQWVPIISRRALKDGSIMLNCSNPYSYRAFDGIKEAFISHSYIIKSNDEYFNTHAMDVRKIAGVSEFIDTHEDGSNEPLDQLFDLPYNEKFADIDYVKYITSKYSKEFLSKIIYAVTKSVDSDKKVYIIAEDITDTDMILDVLKAVYFFIPYALRNKIGYITLFNKQYVPAGINVAFIPETIGDNVKASSTLYNNYIANDFLFDLRTEEVVFTGEINLDSDIEYLDFIRMLINDVGNSAEKILGYINSQSMGSASLADIELIVSFIMELNFRKDVTTLIQMYVNLKKKFSSDYSINMLFTLFNQVVNSGRVFNVSETKALVSLYSVVSENHKEAVMDFVRNSINASISDVDTFFAKIDACNGSAISEFIVSEFIMPNDNAIKLYYGRVFDNCNSIKEIEVKVLSLEKSEIAIDDRLLENPSFVDVLLNSIKNLLAKDETFNSAIALKVFSKKISTASLRERSDRVLKNYFDSYFAHKDVTDLAVEDMHTLSTDFADYIGEVQEEFLNYVLITYGNSEGFGKEDELIAWLHQGKNIDNDDIEAFKKLREFYKRHFSTNELNDHCLAYTLSHTYLEHGAIDVKNAFLGLKQYKDIAKYADWMMKKFRYPSFLNSNNGYDRDFGTEKYRELLNAVLKTLQAFGEKPNKTDAIFIDVIKGSLASQAPYEKELYDTFLAYMKKVSAGKEVPEIPPVSYLIAQEDNSKKKQKNQIQEINQEGFYQHSDSKNEPKSKGKGLVIAIVAVVVALILVVVGVALGIKLGKGNKDSGKTTTTTTTTTTTQNVADIENASEFISTTESTTESTSTDN